MTQRNEFTPRERDCSSATAGAASYDGDLADLPTAEDEITDDLRARITALLVFSDDIENPTAFWAGFVHGVRANLVERSFESKGTLLSARGAHPGAHPGRRKRRLAGVFDPRCAH